MKNVKCRLFFVFFVLAFRLLPLYSILHATVPDTQNNFLKKSTCNDKNKEDIAQKNYDTRTKKAQSKTVQKPGIQVKDERFLVVLVPSYNNKEWYAVNLASIFSQKYTNYHVIYVDDKSSDGTPDLVAQYIKEKKVEDKITLVRNTERLYAAENRYNAIHSCPDHAIIVNLDGDDWWCRDDALSTINETYANSNVWLTYSQFLNWPTNKPGYGHAYPARVIKERSYRSYTWFIGQSRTFYAWLYKQIKKEDLMVDGQFFRATTDVAMMYPLIEMVGARFKYIDEIFYTRNVANDLNLFKVALATQRGNGEIIRERPKYAQINALPFDQNAGICKVEYVTTKMNATENVWTSRIINSDKKI